MREATAFTLGMAIMFASIFTFSFSAEGTHPTGIVINEILYNPEGAEIDGEWVELWNSGSQSVNIQNWSLSDQDSGVDFVFESTTFPANAYILIYTGSGTNSTNFVDNKATYYMGKTSAMWSPTGDDVLLINETGATVDFLSYGDPAVADPPPADIIYVPRNVTAEEGFSLALLGGVFSQSVPTPLEDNKKNEYRPILLTEIHYYPDGENEFVRINNPSQENVDISFWFITDGEGITAFPSGSIINSGQSFYIVQNSTLFFEDTLKIPDFEYVARNTTVKDMLVISSEPQLANGGDEVFVKNNWGLVIDVFTYGTSVYGGEGWNSGPVDTVSQGRVSKRNYDGNYSDTNASEDWENIRPFGIAQSEFNVENFEVNGATLFTSPDSSFEIVASEIDKAQDFILINLYEFANTLLCDKLVAASQRGVKVKLFLEGSPVGGINSTELFIARQIVENGGEVRIMTNDDDNGIHQRYLYDHAKYMVVDNYTLIIMSENWASTGVPFTGRNGNRGWGACIMDAALAIHFATLFYTDWNPSMKDSVSFDTAHLKWGDGQNYMSSGENYTSYFSACVVNSVATVTPVIVPDTAFSNKTVLGMLANAQERVFVEQFYAYKHWGDKGTGSTETTPDIYLEAAIDASRRGCQVRILLDASDYNCEPDDPIDNDDTVEYINGIAETENLDMHAKLVNMAEHDFYKIHNKGVIADDKVLVSSINWNMESVTENRETGIIIQNAEIAGYFVGVFEYDWCDDLTPPTPQFSLNGSYMVNETVVFNASESYDNVGIANLTWILDGNNASNEITWSCNFTESGNHSAELVVSDAWGNSANLSRNFSILSPDIANETSETPGETNNSTTVEQGSDTFLFILIGILLLVPIVVFAAIIILAKYREK